MPWWQDNGLDRRTHTHVLSSREVLDDSTQKVVEFWTSNDNEQVAGALIGALALVPFLWFLG